jgi:Tol biopolymer transport system component
MNDMPDEVLAGIFINSHNADVLEEAKVWNVRIDKPVPENYNPDKEGWVCCRMEILDVFTGMRKVIHESKSRFEAPNWMPDGNSLLFNENGLLYTIPVEGGTPVQLNTGSANRMNNDHGISFNGKLLAVSNHRQGLPGGGSSIYVLPLTGGEPKLITERTPSYFHGWTGDDKWVLYVAQRDTPIYNVYKSPVAGGPEVQLTFFKTGHVDGPEGSPDNKYIYYNGSQTGTMQLYRMKTDGTGIQQLTFDEYNDWFPHISPDGKWILFISFPVDIDPDAHPSYKRVMLRVMPASGGAPRVVAYLYGGQGSINVPSWSPDSKRVAFVSNK